MAAVLVYTNVSYAYADDIVDWLRNNSAIMEQSSMMKDGLRSMEWFVTGMLAKLASACQGLYDVSFGMIDITTNADVNAFIIKWKPVVIAVTALCLLVLGLTLIVEHEKKPKLMQNLMIMVLCVTCSLTAFNGMNQLVKSLKSGVFEGENGEFEPAYSTINEGMVDLVYLNNKYEGLENFNWGNATADDMGAGIAGPEDYKSLNFTEKLNFMSDKYKWKGKTSEILENRIYYYYENGDKKYGKREVDTGVHFLKGNSADEMSLMNEFYYRYTLDVLPTWIQLCALIIIYLTMSYKCVRVVFELIVARLLAYVYSAELSGGEKIRKILVFIRDSYILLVVSCLCIRVYVIFNEYIKTQMAGDTLIKSLFSLFIAFCVIDGPNLVEKLLGMDAGLKSSTARLMAIGGTAMGVAKTAGRTVKGASPRNVADKINRVRSGKISEGGVMAGIYGAASSKAEKAKAKKEEKKYQTVPEGERKPTKNEGPERNSKVTDTSSNSVPESSSAVSAINEGPERNSKVTDTLSNSVPESSSAVSAINEGTANDPGYSGTDSSREETSTKGGAGPEAEGSHDGRTKLNNLGGEKESTAKRKTDSRHKYMNEGMKKGRTGNTSLPERKTTSRSRYTETPKDTRRSMSGPKRTGSKTEHKNFRKDPPLE